MKDFFKIMFYFTIMFLWFMWGGAILGGSFYIPDLWAIISVCSSPIFIAFSMKIMPIIKKEIDKINF